MQLHHFLYFNNFNNQFNFNRHEKSTLRWEGGNNNRKLQNLYTLTAWACFWPAFCIYSESTHSSYVRQCHNRFCSEFCSQTREFANQKMLSDYEFFEHSARNLWFGLRKKIWFGRLVNICGTWGTRDASTPSKI